MIDAPKPSDDHITPHEPTIATDSELELLSRAATGLSDLSPHTVTIREHSIDKSSLVVGLIDTSTPFGEGCMFSVLVTKKRWRGACMFALGADAIKLQSKLVDKLNEVESLRAGAEAALSEKMAECESIEGLIDTAAAQEKRIAELERSKEQLTRAGFAINDRLTTYIELAAAVDWCIQEEDCDQAEDAWETLKRTRRTMLEKRM